MAIGRSWPQGGAFHIVDPVNTTLAVNVFTGTPAPSPNYLCVGVVEWSADVVLPTQDSADGVIGGAVAPDFGIQIGFMDGGIYTAVSEATPLPIIDLNEGAANLDTDQIDVLDTATQIVPANPLRRGVSITNLGTNDVWLGTASVTSSTGDLLIGVRGAAVYIPTTAAVYGIVDTESPAIDQPVSYVEVYD